MNEIAPCPNPACKKPDIKPLLWVCDDGNEGYVLHACGLRSPSAPKNKDNGHAEIIAAWNSISMGWRESAKSPPPRTGDLLLAVINQKGHRFRDIICPETADTWEDEDGNELDPPVKRPVWEGFQWDPMSECSLTYEESEVELWQLIAPIPPLPEGK